MKKRLKKKLYTDRFYDDFRYICMEKHPPKFRINTISRMRENYGLAKYERRTVDYSPRELRTLSVVLIGKKYKKKRNQKI